MTEPSDFELARSLGSKVRATREEAFATLFRRHHQRAFDLAWRVLGDASLAADVVQEAFLTVYRKGRRFEARAQFSSWLYRVVLNQAIDLRRREKRHRMAPLDEASEESQREHASQSAPPDAGALAAERAEVVRLAIARLSPKLAAVVHLRYPEAMSYEEIGEILALPPGTVRSRLNRAHAALREILGERLDDT
jgi:RNA polymerase sigma-70 factor (ECF subfamily)